MLEQRIKATFGQYQVPAVVHAVQGDTGRVFIFESQDRQITGTETAALMCIRPDGTAFSYTGTVDPDLNEITVDLDVEGGALSQAGVVAAQLVMQEDGLVLCSFKLGIIVEEVLGGEASQEDITFLAGLQAQLDAWISSAASNFVPSTRTVNGKALSSNITINAEEVPYDNTASGLTADDVQEAIDELSDEKLDSASATVNGKALPATLYVQDLTSNDTNPTSPTYAKTNVELTQMRLQYTDYTKTNITIPSSQYTQVATFSTIGVPADASVVSFYIRGWSGVQNLSLVASSDGKTLYVQAPTTGTITTMTVRVFYAML